MNRYHIISALGLLALVIAVPIYAAREQARLSLAQDQLQAQSIENGAVLYLQFCGECHGPTGEGNDLNPALNRLGLAEADPIEGTGEEGVWVVAELQSPLGPLTEYTYVWLAAQTDAFISIKLDNSFTVEPKRHGRIATYIRMKRTGVGDGDIAVEKDARPLR